MSEVGRVSLGIELGGNVIKQIHSAANSMGSIFSKSLKSSFQGVFKGVQATAKSMPVPKVDVSAAKAEIEQLTAVLDNTNARLEFQNRKLADLREQYKNTFNEARKTKLEGQILTTEAAILRLEKQSDSTASKIWKLEDSIAQAGQAAQQTNPPVIDLDKRLKNTNRTLKTTDRQLKSTSKNTSNLGNALKSTGKRMTGVGNQFTQAFKRIARQVLIFAVLYKAIRGFQNFMSSSLKTNEDFRKSLVAIKTNMLVAFQPIYDAILPAINALMRGLAKATAYIAAFTSALFGKTYRESYKAAKGLNEARKAMDGYGKAAGKASGSLAAFDELNVLDDGTDAGGGLGIDPLGMDVTALEAQMDGLTAGMKATFDRVFNGIRAGWASAIGTFGPSLKGAWETVKPELALWGEQFRSMFADILSLGEPLKNWWQAHLIPYWENGVGIAAQVLSGLSESIRMVIGTLWEAVFPVFEKLIAEGLPRLTEFAMGVQDIFGGIFQTAKTIFDDIWQGVIAPVLDILSGIIQDALDIWLGMWDRWGVKILDGIRSALDGISSLWSTWWENYLRPIVTKMLEVMSNLWTNHLSGLVKEIGNFVGKLVSAALDIFNKFVLPVTNWLVKKLGPVFSEIIGGLVIEVIDTALGAIIDFTKGIFKALGGLIDFIAGVFTGDWKRAWEGVKTVIGGVWDGIVALLKGAINIIIDAINFLIRQLNKISFDFPDWVPMVGGKSFGISIPEIPKLAKGGLVQGPTLAMVGDNPGANVDPEVVSPLSKLQEMIGGSNQEVVEVLYMILAALQDYSRRPVILESNGTQLAKAVDAARDDRNRRAGRTLSMA